jgi:transcription elongation GreA/GreB family factor
LPKRNYGYEKRQKELHKQQKREEKLKRKLERADVPATEPEDDETASPPQAE